MRPDGRCISSLLKILLTNSCIFDCHYCINRKSSNVRGVRGSRRRSRPHIASTSAISRGPVPPSGIIASSNYTMEQMVEVAAAARGSSSRLHPSQDDPRRRSRTRPPGRCKVTASRSTSNSLTANGLKRPASRRTACCPYRDRDGRGEGLDHRRQGRQGQVQVRAPRYAPAASRPR